MTKVAINRCYGGFSLSRPATEMLRDMGHQEAAEHLKWVDERGQGRWYGFRPEDRADLAVIDVIERLGNIADGDCAAIQIVEIPDDVTGWHVEEYDGREWVAENHRTW